ncbi:hypothetical protein AMTR_s04308p00006740, partial [Amborella trichopoda]
MEVDVSNPLPTKVWIGTGPNEGFWQKLKFEGKPISPFENSLLLLRIPLLSQSPLTRQTSWQKKQKIETKKFFEADHYDAALDQSSDHPNPTKENPNVVLDSVHAPDPKPSSTKAPAPNESTSKNVTAQPDSVPDDQVTHPPASEVIPSPSNLIVTAVGKENIADTAMQIPNTVDHPNSSIFVDGKPI